MNLTCYVFDIIYTYYIYKISTIPPPPKKKFNYPKNDLASSTNRFSAKITLENEIIKYSAFSLGRLLS